MTYEPYPLLDATDGTSALDLAQCKRTDTVDGVLASDGPSGRQTQAVHERRKRTYEIDLRTATAEQIDRVREVMALTRHGSVPTRWRHPIDDPPPAPPAPPSPGGDVESAPRYRCLAGSQLNPLTLERSSGGQYASATLTLEEV